ncbi:hypothetical protein HYX58_04100 [Candidatus Dependentiae bacterium]|nr:hypothetical protein [Candidatus Dependentiae bacterium]
MELTKKTAAPIIFNELAWQLIFRTIIDTTYEQDSGKDKCTVKNEMRNIALCCTSLNKIVKNLGSDDSFNNYFILRRAPNIKFKNSRLNDLISKQMLAAAHLGTPSALKILEKQLQEGTLTSIKLVLDAKFKSRQHLVPWFFACSNTCGGEYETTVSIAEALADVLKNFPKTTQLFCHNVLKERQKQTPSFAKTQSVSSELDKLAAAYDEKEES